MASDLRIYNTTVSGSALNSALNSDDVRSLEFTAALGQAAPKILTSAAVSPLGDTLSVNDWVQATTDSLGLNVSGGTGINLGPDSATGASFYQNLFALNNTTDRRLLRFYLSATGTNNVVLRNSSSSPSTSSNVSVTVNGGSASGSGVLFNVSSGATGPQAGNLAGLQRMVLLSAPAVPPDTPQVRFDILSGSL